MISCRSFVLEELHKQDYRLQAPKICRECVRLEKMSIRQIDGGQDAGRVSLTSIFPMHRAMMMVH